MTKEEQELFWKEWNAKHSSYEFVWDSREELQAKLDIAVSALRRIMENKYEGIENHAQGTALLALDKIRTL